MSASPVPLQCDVAVIGAGPAGLAAATLTARAGLDTVVFDEQPGCGGQIYRAIGATAVDAAAILGPDYLRGRDLLNAFNASGARHIPSAAVWSLSAALELGVSIDGRAGVVRSRRVILASGALERPFPIQGWTLPGVMSAGAAQIALKTSGLIPAGRTVMAGCGPLLWLLAWQYLRAGLRIDAILDTTPRRNLFGALPYLPGFLASPLFRKGLSLVTTVRRAVRVIDGVTDLRVLGTDRAEGVAYRTNDSERQLPAELVLLHQGVVPNVNLAMSAQIAHRWDDDQLCWHPVLDENGGTSMNGIAIAGDGAGIAGAQAAEFRGRLAGIAAIRALRPDTADLESTAQTARRDLAGHRRGRRFLDRLYRPARQFRLPQGDTIVCRCEEVTARQVENTVALGCPGPNQLKAFLRCGMGPCQGRMCGLTVTELIAAARGVPPGEVGPYRLRPPAKPLTLAELASLPQSEAALRAVIRD